MVLRSNALAKRIAAAIRRLNSHYGRGDVVWINYQHNTVFCKKQYGGDICKFRYENKTVYFRGHQQKVWGLRK